MSTDGAVPPPPQLYSLKWGNHNRFLTQMLYSQCGDRKYTDMTVSLDDGNFFHCHKLVLSSCSDFFKSYFARSQCSNPVVVIPNVSKEVFSMLITYMYLGELNCPQDQLNSLLQISERLKIKGLLKDEDPSVSMTDNFVPQPILPVKSLDNKIPNHMCDDDDLESDFSRKIVVNPWTGSEERVPMNTPVRTSAVSHQHQQQNKQHSSSKGRKGYQPKKLPRNGSGTPEVIVHQEHLMRPMSVSPSPLVISEPAAPTEYGQREKSPAANSLSSAASGRSGTPTSLEGPLQLTAGGAGGAGDMQAVDLSSPSHGGAAVTKTSKRVRCDSAAAVAAAKANGNSTSPLTMDAIQNYFKMTGGKDGGSALLDSIANKSLEQYLANNISTNGSPSLLSLTDTMGLDPSSLADRMRQYFKGVPTPGAFPTVGQTPAAAAGSASFLPDDSDFDSSKLLKLDENALKIGRKPGKPEKRPPVRMVTGPDGKPQIGANGKPIVKCEVCDKELADPSSLYRHRKIHDGVKPHKCDFCDRRFIQRYNMVQHMKVHEKKMRKEQQKELGMQMLHAIQSG